MKRAILFIYLFVPLICLAQFGTDNTQQPHLVIKPADKAGQWWVEVSDKDNFKRAMPIQLTISLQRPKKGEPTTGEVFDLGAMINQDRRKAIKLWVPLDQLTEPGHYFLVVEAAGYSRSWWKFQLILNP